MLNLYRRHLQTCPHRGEGRAYTKCSCPIWVDGELEGKRCLRSLKTRDWQRAIRLAERLERPNAERLDLAPCAQPGCNVRVEGGRCAEHRKNLAAAIQAFHAANTLLGYGTQRHYKSALKFFLTSVGEVDVHEIQSGSIDAFRVSRSLGALTWSKQLMLLRHLFRFCIDNKWTLENPAVRVSLPKNIKPTDKEPYTRAEVIRILAACDTIGNHAYERLRARAMVLLLRYTALRISDVVTLARDRIRNGEIYLRTLKSGKIVRLPVPTELRAALDMVPVTRGTTGESRYFFWSGSGEARTTIRNGTRTLSAVFKASGVPAAHAHRFRHYAASRTMPRVGAHAAMHIGLSCADAA